MVILCIRQIVYVMEVRRLTILVLALTYYATV